MKYKTILFDFDGTLADSQPLMIRALNMVAPEFGFRPIADEELPRLKMLPYSVFITRRLHIPLWKVLTLRRLEKRSKEEFAKFTTAPEMFPGIPHMLSLLKDRGLVLGIVSSGVPEVIRRVLEQHAVEFHVIEAGTSSLRKSAAIKRALRRHGIDKRSVIYVGDELRDLAACKKAGIPMIGVPWGLNDKAALEKRGVPVASTPDDLLRMLSA